MSPMWHWLQLGPTMLNCKEIQKVFLLSSPWSKRRRGQGLIWGVGVWLTRSIYHRELNSSTKWEVFPGHQKSEQTLRVGTSSEFDFISSSKWSWSLIKHDFRGFLYKCSINKKQHPCLGRHTSTIMGEGMVGGRSWRTKVRCDFDAQGEIKNQNGSH